MKSFKLLSIGLVAFFIVLSTSAGNSIVRDEGGALISFGAGNPCDAGVDKNFENCRDNNCTEQLNIQCTFTYDKDVLTIWGRRGNK
jgi:hypothetical protein